MPKKQSKYWPNYKKSIGSTLPGLIVPSGLDLLGGGSFPNPGNRLLFNPATYGLVSWWLNDTTGGGAAITADAYGTNTLTNNNGVTSVSGVSGSTGAAGGFVAASNQSLTCSSNSGLQTGTVDFWIATWVYLTSETNHRRIIAKGPSLGSCEYTLEFNFSTSFFEFETTSDGSSFSSLTASNLGVPALNTWYFILAWYDSVGQALRIKINDNASYLQSLASVPTVFSGSGALSIGTSFGTFMDGRLGPLAFGKPPTPLGNGTAGTLANTLSTLLWNGGVGRKYPF